VSFALALGRCEKSAKTRAKMILDHILLLIFKVMARRGRMSRAKQRHTHEFLGSTKLAEQGADRHNHRFAGVTSEAIPIKGNNHIHTITVNTDFLDHHHKLIIKTGPAIPIGNGKHIHFVKGVTTVNDNHVHRFEFTTLIDRPLV
jgi:hypothetical protein